MIYAWSYTKEAIFFTSFNVARAINLCGWGTCQDLGGFWTYNAVLQFSCSITGLTRVYAYSEVEKNNWANRWLWHLNRSISISIYIIYIYISSMVVMVELLGSTIYDFCRCITDLLRREMAMPICNSYVNIEIRIYIYNISYIYNVYNICVCLSLYIYIYIPDYSCIYHRIS